MIHREHAVIPNVAVRVEMARPGVITQFPEQGESSVALHELFYLFYFLEIGTNTSVSLKYFSFLLT